MMISPNIRRHDTPIRPDDLAIVPAPLVSVTDLLVSEGDISVADDDAHLILVPFDGQPYRVTLRQGADRTLLSIEDGQIVLIPSATKTSLEWHQQVAGSLVRLNPARMKDFVRSDLRVLVDETSSANVRMVLDGDLTGLADRMRKAALQDTIGRDAALQAMAQLFIVTLVRNHAVLTSEQTLSADKLSLDQFHTLCRHVDDNLDAQIRVDDLAHVIGVSLSSLARKLGAELGLTPLQFITERRLKRAQTLLTATSSPIGTIEYECGFSDQAHLSRAFRRRFNMTPSQQRQMGRPRLSR